jgi:hypothetical protein
MSAGIAATAFGPIAPRACYRAEPHRGSIASGSEERGKREPWKATVDLDATD